MTREVLLEVLDHNNSRETYNAKIAECRENCILECSSACSRPAMDTGASPTDGGAIFLLTVG